MSITRNWLDFNVFRVSRSIKNFVGRYFVQMTNTEKMSLPISTEMLFVKVSRNTIISKVYVWLHTNVSGKIYFIVIDDIKKTIQQIT